MKSPTDWILLKKKYLLFLILIFNQKPSNFFFEVNLIFLLYGFNCLLWTYSKVFCIKGMKEKLTYSNLRHEMNDKSVKGHLDRKIERDRQWERQSEWEIEIRYLERKEREKDRKRETQRER